MTTATTGEVRQLVGAYKVVASEKFGRLQPPRRIDATFVTFTEDHVIVTDCRHQYTYEAAYEIDTTRRPWRITMTASDTVFDCEASVGLIEVDGDALRLVYALPGEAKPTGFRTGFGQLMFEMIRHPAAADAA